MEPEGSLPCSHEHDSDSQDSNSHPHVILRIHFNIILPYMSGTFPSSYPTKILYVFIVSPIHVTFCKTHISVKGG